MRKYCKNAIATWKRHSSQRGGKTRAMQDTKASFWLLFDVYASIFSIHVSNLCVCTVFLAKESVALCF